MTNRKVVGKAADVAAVPMAGDGIEGVVKRVLVSPEQGWDGWVMRLFDVDLGGHTPKHMHDWPHINFVASGHGVLLLDGERKQDVKPVRLKREETVRSGCLVHGGLYIK